MMTKAMISQPMAGETDEWIVATREKAMEDLEAMGYEVVNTLFTMLALVLAKIDVANERGGSRG